MAFAYTSSYASSKFMGDEDVFLEVVFADEDGDGVDDEDDACAGTPAGENVDANGCSESQKDDDNDGVFNNLDACPSTNEGVEIDENGCEISCSVSLSLSSGPISQAVLEGASITEVIFTYGTDCAEDGFDFDVVGLPNGVFWSRSGEDLIVSGAAETEPGIYEYYAIIRVNNSSKNASVTGFIEVSENGTTTQECSINLSLSSGPISQGVEVGAPINDVVFEFESDCSDLNISVEGLPDGIFWEDQGNNIIISGTVQSEPGVYEYSLLIISNSSQAIIQGVIGVNGESIQECSINLDLVSGPEGQVLENGVAIENVIYQFSSDCEDTNITVEGLPDGVFWEVQQNDIIIYGQIESEPGEYIYSISISSSSTQSFIEGVIIVSKEDCYLDLIVLSGPQFQVVQIGSLISEVVYEFNSDCKGSNIGESIVIEGLPEGVSWSGEGNVIVISGEANGPAGSYVYLISVNSSSTQAFIEGEILVLDDVKLEDDDDNDGVPNFFDKCSATEEGAAVDAFGCSEGQNQTFGDIFITDNGCEISIYNMPQPGEVIEICVTEPFQNQLVVSSTCSNSNISSEVNGLPTGWSYTSSLDENNNLILTVLSGEDQVEGTFDSWCSKP